VTAEPAAAFDDHSFSDSEMPPMTGERQSPKQYPRKNAADKRSDGTGGEIREARMSSGNENLR
jgi:hypothetical protein